MLGGDLRYRLDRNGPLGEECTRFYAAEIALALDYLHSQRIVHRDIKPDNLLLNQDGHIHLTDFNVAVRVRKDRLLTAAAGTRAYMGALLAALALTAADHRSQPPKCLAKRSSRRGTLPRSTGGAWALCCTSACTARGRSRARATRSPTQSSHKTMSSPRVKCRPSAKTPFALYAPFFLGGLADRICTVYAKEP